MEKLEQKQILAPLGTHLPEKEEVIKLFQDMKLIYESAAQRSSNNYEYAKLFHYLDLFIENEKERSFLMDRLSDFIIQYGQAWFDKKTQATDLSSISEDIEDLGENLAIKIADKAVENLKKYPEMPESAHGITYFDYLSIEKHRDCESAKEWDWNTESEITNAIEEPWENLTPIEGLVKSYMEDFSDDTDQFYNIVRDKVDIKIEENFNTERIQNYIKKYGYKIKDVPGKVTLN